MIGHRYLGGLTAILLVLAVLLTCFVMAGAENASIPITEASVPDYEAIFDKDAVMAINIEADEEEFQEMLDSATEEEYIQCDVTVNGTTVHGAGIRPKGNSSLSMVASSRESDRFSFKLEFDHYVENQNLMGLDKMVINNIQGDTTYMKEYLSYDIMSYMEVPTPLFAFADVTVNGEPWGFYLAVEALEDSYALRNFGTGHGMLYKPEGMGMRGAGRMNEFINDADDTDDKKDANDTDAPNDRKDTKDTKVTNATTDDTNNRARALDQGLAAGGRENEAKRITPGAWPGAGDALQGAGRQISAPGGMSSGNGVDLVYRGDDPEDYPDIFDNAVFPAAKKDYNRVIKALKDLNDGTELEKAIDVDEVLRYFAVNTFVVNLDHYASNMGHNYYLYEEDGMLSMLPWDYNLAFGGFQAGSSSSVVNFPIDTPVSGVDLEDRPMIGKLLEVPEYKERYHEYLRQIGDDYFQTEVYNNKVDTLDSLIGNYVKEDASAFYSYDQYRSGLEALKGFGQLRAESVLGQLAGELPSTAEGQSKDSSALIDASGLDFATLGSMGGGKGGFGRSRDGEIPGEQMPGEPEDGISEMPEDGMPEVAEGNKPKMPDSELSGMPKMPEGGMAPGAIRQPPDMGDGQDDGQERGMQRPDMDSGRSRQNADMPASQADALRNAAGIWTLNDPSLIKTAVISSAFLIGGLLFVRKFPRRRYRI